MSSDVNTGKCNEGEAIPQPQNAAGNVGAKEDQLTSDEISNYKVMNI